MINFLRNASAIINNVMSFFTGISDLFVTIFGLIPQPFGGILITVTVLIIGIIIVKSVL